MTNSPLNGKNGSSGKTRSGYFPLRVRMLDTDKVLVAKTPGELPKGREFVVLDSGYDACDEAQPFPSTEAQEAA